MLQASGYLQNINVNAGVGDASSIASFGDLESSLEEVGGFLETRSLQLDEVKSGRCYPFIPLSIGISPRVTEDVRPYALLSKAELKKVFF